MQTKLQVGDCTVSMPTLWRRHFGKNVWAPKGFDAISTFSWKLKSLDYITLTWNLLFLVNFFIETFLRKLVNWNGPHPRFIGTIINNSSCASSFGETTVSCLLVLASFNNKSVSNVCFTRWALFMYLVLDDCRTSVIRPLLFCFSAINSIIFSCIFVSGTKL